MTEEITDLEILRCMEQRGGSFVRALANAAMYADDRNLERLKLAFDDYWSTYREMAKAMKERNE